MSQDDAKEAKGLLAEVTVRADANATVASGGSDGAGGGESAAAAPPAGESGGALSTTSGCAKRRAHRNPGGDGGGQPDPTMDTAALKHRMRMLAPSPFVFVGRLPPWASRGWLLKIFSRFGRLRERDISVVMGRSGGGLHKGGARVASSKGQTHAFVNFSCALDAMRALGTLCRCDAAGLPSDEACLREDAGEQGGEHGGDGSEVGGGGGEGGEGGGDEGRRTCVASWVAVCPALGTTGSCA